MTLAQAYKKSLAQKLLMRFTLVGEPETNYHGIVVHIARGFVVIREFADFDRGALQILPKRQIRKFRFNKCDQTGNAILSHSGAIKRIAPPRWLVACKRVRDVAAEFRARKIWPGVEELGAGKLRTSSIHIGRVVAESREELSLETYDKTGHWIGKTAVPWADVARIQFQDPYTRRFNEFVRNCRWPPEEHPAPQRPRTRKRPQGMTLANAYKASLSEKLYMAFTVSGKDDDTHHGVVLHIARRFIVLREFSGLEPDGILVIPKQRITNFELGPHEECVNEMIRANSLIRKLNVPKWLEKAAGLADVVRELRRRRIWPSVETVFQDGGATISPFYVGPVIDLHVDEFRLFSYDAAGRWEHPARIDWDEILRVEFQDAYTKRFNAYMRDTNWPPKEADPPVW